jgi:beta-xylosidase
MRRRLAAIPVVAALVALNTTGAAATKTTTTETTTTETTTTPLTTSATIINFDQSGPRPADQPHGAQVVKLDAAGNHLDAGADFITYFDGSYYLYGESAGCGFRFQFGQFCGFHVFQSPTWSTGRSGASCSTRRPPARAAGAPMVVHNRKTGKYVLWFYTWSPPEDSRLPYVAEGDSPTGPFGTPRPAANIPPGDGFAPDIFVDSGGSAYLTSGRLQPAYPGCPIPSGCPFGLVVQKLNDTYTGGTGSVTTVTRPPISPQLESPSILHDGDRYYLLTNPICAYCETQTNLMAGKATCTRPNCASCSEYHRGPRYP